jgi:hypothetical protein
VDAFLRYPAVQSVEYDPADNPTRAAVVYATPRKDTSVISRDLRKAELFINNRASSSACGGSTGSAAGPGSEAGGGGGAAGGEGCLLVLELYRQVAQARQQGAVYDYAVISRFGLQADGSVDVAQRVAAFMQPQDALYFEAGDRAVALYDYSHTYTKAGGGAAE